MEGLPRELHTHMAAGALPLLGPGDLKRRDLRRRLGDARHGGPTQLGPPEFRRCCSRHARPEVRE